MRRHRKRSAEKLSFGKRAFSGYSNHRYGSASPVSLAGSRRADPIFDPERRMEMILGLAVEFSAWEFSAFEKEGPYTQAMRSRLCLMGHSWRAADHEAWAIVGGALRLMGVPRPTEEQGQPEHTDSPDRCSWCAGALDEGGSGKASRYCSDVCAKSAFRSRDFARRSLTDKAYASVHRVIRRSRQDERVCEECADTFKPISAKSKQRFCSFACGSKNRSRRTAPPNMVSIAVTMACAYCGGDFEARHRKALLCSKACSSAWYKTRNGGAPKVMKAHVFDHYITRRIRPPEISGARFDFMLWQSGATITAEVEMPAPRITDRLFADA